MVMALKQKKKLLMTGLITIASFVISSCGNNPNPSNSSSSSSSSSETTSESTSEEIVMTESYAKARDEFNEVTRVELPIFSDMEVEPYSYKEGDTTYCFKIISGKNLKYQNYFVFEDYFIELFGEPDKSDKTTHEENNRYAEWTRNDRWYQTFWDASIKTIAINTAQRKIDPVLYESYVTSREQFKEVTGIELPIVYDVKADEMYIAKYVPGQKEYIISLIFGSKLNYDTYLIFENFFKELIGDCDEGYPTGDETSENGRTAKWTLLNREYITHFDKTIQIETKPTSTQEMSESYKEGRNKFHEITGLLLMELYGVEILDSSYFDYDKHVAQICFNGDETLFNDVLTYLSLYISSDPILKEDTQVKWEYDFEESDKKYFATFVLSINDKVISILGSINEYRTITLLSDDNGSVSMRYHGDLISDNTIAILDGETLQFNAYPNQDYEFKGWYINDEEVSTSSPMTYLVSQKDETIYGKFEYSPVNMTESYKKARDEFYLVSNILLPALEGIEVDDYPYTEGDTQYSFKVIGGDNLSSQTFDTIYEFLDNELTSWSKEQYTKDDDSLCYKYTSVFLDELELIYTLESDMFTINILMQESIDLDYEQSTYAFNYLFGTNIPVFEDVSLMSSSFERDGSAVNFGFYSETFSDETYVVVENCFKEVLREYSSKIEDEYGYTLTWLKDEKTFELIITSISQIISINVY